MSSRRWAAGLFFISAALLGYELLLMRLLTLAYWGHFAGFVISIAMLGLAASGLFLFFARERVRVAPQNYFAASAGLFGALAPLVFLGSQRLPFTPFLLTWSLHEYALLAGRSLLFFAPFFFGGIAIGTPFVAHVLPIGRLYFWNMLGSGLPALPLLFAMNFTHPLRLLCAVAVLALGASAIATMRIAARLGCLLAGSCVLAAVILSPFRYSEYKDLPKTLLLPDAGLLEERYGWDGVVQIVDSPHTRYLPGLSLNYTGTLPPSKLVFTDAGATTLAFAPEEALANDDFLRMTPEAFSFALVRSPSVLQFYGSTADLLRVRLFASNDSRIVDDNATRVAAVQSVLANDEIAGLLVCGDARQSIETQRQPQAPWRVIGVSLLGTHGTATAGAASLDPSFLLTVEGCSRLLKSVHMGGHAVFTTWVENPPRSGIRLIALLVETLRHHVNNPSAHLMALRSYSTLSIFASEEPFTPDAIRALKEFCEQHSFDPVWYDGIDPVETNRFNVLPDEPYYGGFAVLLEQNRQQYIARSPFAVDAPTDDRPFFNQYFRWAAVPQWISTMGLSWLPFVEWGYILHLAAFVVVTLLGLLLLIVPCLLVRSRPPLSVASLFFSLGVAYMFVQIWAIYKLSQLVAHPLLASALVLSVMLAASGVGAALLTRRTSPPTAIRFASLCGTLLIALFLFPVLLDVFYPHTASVRLIIGVLWLAVPAFFMGFPFPNALARLRSETDVPWALALNGFGSVIGSLLATLVAVHFGLRMLALSAIALYALIAFLSRGNSTRLLGSQS